MARNQDSVKYLELEQSTLNELRKRARELNIPKVEKLEKQPNDSKKGEQE